MAEGVPKNLWDSLTSSSRNAAQALMFEFGRFNLNSLGPRIIEYVKKGFSADTITLLLQQTPEYMTRFQGNEIRKKKGLPVLSPSEYLATESAYKQILSQAGMPKGFYDKPSDFNAWIGGDVAPTEIKARADVASEIVHRDGAAIKTAFRRYYGSMPTDSQLVAYVLDQKRALPVIEMQLKTAEVSAAKFTAKLGYADQDMAEYAAKQGVGYEEARKAYGQIGSFIGQAETLANIYHEHYGMHEAEEEFLLGVGKSEVLRKKLASKERATFEASSGVGQGSLSQGQPRA